MNSAAQLVFICIIFSFANAAENFCDDWDSYKEEKCIKLINNANLQSFADAEKTCTANENSKLISIHSSDEQTFLENYFFKQKAVVDNIWLNAKSDNSHVFHWNDGRPLTFSNWAPNNPKTSSSSTANICVQMNSDELVRGKWANEPCTKKNLVVCERKQKWTLEKMQEVIERQHEQNEKLQKTIEQLQRDGKQNKETNEKLHKTIEQLQGEGKQNKETNEKMQRKIEKLTKNHIPIGFIYVQLPKEKSPQEIWSSEIKWTDVSSIYENIFFRVVGSKTEAFGKVQEDFSPYIDKVSYFCQGKYGTNSPCSYVTEAHIPRSGGWSGDLYTVRKFKGPGDDNESINFHFSGGEVRPRNMAIRVWKRTG